VLQPQVHCVLLITYVCTSNVGRAGQVIVLLSLSTPGGTKRTFCEAGMQVLP